MSQRSSQFPQLRTNIFGLSTGSLIPTFCPPNPQSIPPGRQVEMVVCLQATHRPSRRCDVKTYAGERGQRPGPLTSIPCLPLIPCQHLLLLRQLISKDALF